MSDKPTVKPVALPETPVLDPAAVEARPGVTGYPEPFRAAVAGRLRKRLGNPLGITNFGVNLTRLEPGAASALRHWHTRQDEFVYVLEGELTLVTDAGETLLRPGMCAGFPAGKPDGHQLVNRSGEPAAYLEVGDRTAGDEVDYPDDDLRYDGTADRYSHRDGTPW
ncbi:cupin domain-containing protein [Azospirillum isscasi]|uniref:Cupin domain-containing protein n=1 Tax=Azospirillum isscasi TaxID=3053926 RepID=A0ABU0WAT8_9PROT|nr:cupin domain-containing protein [Azospirillum isscasi]MDQ2101305.1 cupin domain-containing protein [Azospirillum isscasi]